MIEEAQRFGLIVTWIYSSDPNEWQPAGGVVEISRNTIRSGVAGVSVVGPYTIQIVGNTIESIGTNSIVGLSVEGQKAVGLIADNDVLNFQWGVELYATSNEQFQGAVVSGNRITGVPKGGYGLLINGGFVHDCLVENNSIETNQKNWAAISTDSYNNRFQNNVLTGIANWAVYLTCLTPGSVVAHNEFFEANSVAGFTPVLAHYYLDWTTHYNTINAICSENATCVDDNGADTTNVFSCLNNHANSSFAALPQILGTVFERTPRPKIIW